MTQCATRTAAAHHSLGAQLQRALDALDVRAVARLLRHGANPNYQATAMDDTPLGRLLARPGARSAQCLQVAHQLIGAGADATWRYPLGSKPLLHAAVSVSSDLVKLLLRHADVDARDARGVSALHVAACWGN